MGPRPVSSSIRGMAAAVLIKPVLRTRRGTSPITPFEKEDVMTTSRLICGGPSKRAKMDDGGRLGEPESAR